jgi:hypothetical protein
MALLLDRGEGKLFGKLDVLERAKVLILQGEVNPYNSALRWRKFIMPGEQMPNVLESFEQIKINVSRASEQWVDGDKTMSRSTMRGEVDERLERAVVELGIEVVVLDPWAVFLGANENVNDEVEAALSALRRISLKYGTAFIVVHHIRKPGSGDTSEPEDMWRGASRLADWASTRVTMLPHFTIKQAKELGLTRQESRKYADIFFLRRSAPVDDMSVRRDGNGWWVGWDPDDSGPELSPLSIANAINGFNGQPVSVSELMGVMNVGPARATRAIERASGEGLIKSTKVGQLAAWTTV